jgi:hypothetical protein
MVKPDYNNWEGKDNYAERFMDIIEKSFCKINLEKKMPFFKPNTLL